MLIYTVIGIGILFAVYALVSKRRGVEEYHPLHDDQKAEKLYNSAREK